DGWQCPAKTPEAETCNYKDDDCDGATDEGSLISGIYSTDTDCGQCGNDCSKAVLFAETTKCETDVATGEAFCVALTCQPNYYVPKANNRLCVPSVGGDDCSPCTKDENCQGIPGGTCVAIDPGTFCLRSCAVQADCELD